MRNEVLKFVYNMMPENEKEVMEALEQTEDDEKAEQNDVNTDAVKTEGDEIAQEISEATGKASAETPSETNAAPSAESSAAITPGKPLDSEVIPNKSDEINVF